MLEDDITDEEMMALAAATSTRTTTQAAPAWSSAANAAAAAASAPRSFQSAFASMTTSSHYTSVANMPLPPPSTAAASGTASAAALSSAVRPARPGGSSLAPVPKAQSAHSILVSPRQRGNPVLTHISNVAWELGPRDMSADYVLGETCAALYLSLKYHLLHGNYVASRMAACGAAFTLRVLLLLVDVDDSERPMLDLSKLCFAHGWTLVCCWSAEETARYLETLKAYEKKTSAAIEERVDHADHAATLLDALTQVRSINKTDVRQLLTNFGSFAGLAQASKEELTAVPGMGERKVHRLHHVFNQPFITSQMRLRTDVASSVTNPA
jgi:DNA excision repair protein ERCC-1